MTPQTKSPAALLVGATGRALASRPGQAPEPPVKTPGQQTESDEMKTLAAQRRGRSAFTGEMARRAINDSVLKLDPRVQLKNPVMFVVEVGSVITTIATVQAFATG